MKTADVKSNAGQSARTKQPFFSKGCNGLFANTQRKTFFGSNKPVQAKLNIGPANDKYEKEADHVADKVVQRLSKSETDRAHINTHTVPKAVQARPLGPVAPISPLIQAKCTSCESEEKLQEGKEKKEQKQGKLQKKIASGANAEPPVDHPDDEKQDSKNLQRKCASCEQDEKLQKKDAEAAAGMAVASLQRKPIFESNARQEDSLQRKCASCEQEEHLQKKESGEGSHTASPSIESGLRSTKGGGSPMPQSTRTQMESAMGADFSGVRVHTGTTAAQLSNDLNAQAFTQGYDIYFNSGKYDTGSTEGRHLLAHELTHTVQQGASLHRKENVPENNINIQKKAAPAPTSSGVVNLSQGTFSPPEAIQKEIESAGPQGLNVRIRVGPFAEEGVIKITKKGNSYSAGEYAYLTLTNTWFRKFPALVLLVDIKDSQVTGLITAKRLGKAKEGFIQTIKTMESEIGMGFHFSKKLSGKENIVNELKEGTLSLGFKDLAIKIGGFFDMNLNFAMENMANPVFDGSGKLTLTGAEGVVNVDNKHQGKLGGSGSLTITGFKGFSGVLEVKYDAETGLVDIHGNAEYSGDKLSGSIELVSTDFQTANNFAKDAIKAAGGVENAKEAAPPTAVPAPKESPKRGLAGVGQLQFNLTDWFAGTVNVVVDAVGHITVIGKIAPPAEITLFKQKNWDNELFKFEAKAYYGIPVIGNLNLFANVSLHSIAKLGPAKIYNIEILGTYSTDPEVQKNIQIAGSINISGYAGLRLRAEGGAGVEILEHDLKFGVGVQADVGVEAYADARPVIGWRDPGQFYISGTLDLVAQPVLGLGGDFFIQLETPWWSPLSDKKWTWPLFSKQWPLGDPIGLSATMKDYVLGSGTVPDITFKKPEFDSSKFMTDMVDDTLPDKKGDGGSGSGAFKEDGSVSKPAVPDKKKPKADAAQAAKGKPKKGKDAPAKPGKTKPDKKSDQEAAKLFQAAGAKLKGAVKEPVTRADLQKKLTEIEHSTPGIKFSIQPQENKWVVSSVAKQVKNPHPVKFDALLTEADKKGKTDNTLVIHEPFELDGEKHEIDTKHGSNELVMSSSNPFLLSSHPDKSVRDAYTKYLKVIKDAKTPTERKEKAKEQLLVIISKIKAAKMSSAPGSSAPGIGTVDMHKDQQSRLRRSKIEVWFMESEHVIPRAIISSAFEALAQTGIPAGGADYQKMHTILIYKGAARVKTAGAGDLSIINDFKTTVAEIVQAMQSNPSNFPVLLPTLIKSVSKLLESFANDAVERTNESVKEENVHYGKFRGPQQKPEPPTPAPGLVEKAFNKQKQDLYSQYRDRINKWVDGIKQEAKKSKYD